MRPTATARARSSPHRRTHEQQRRIEAVAVSAAIRAEAEAYVRAHTIKPDPLTKRDRIIGDWRARMDEQIGDWRATADAAIAPATETRRSA